MSLITRVLKGAAVLAVSGTLLAGLATAASAGPVTDAKKVEFTVDAKKAQAPVAQLPSGVSAQASIRGFEHAYYGGARVMTNDIANRCTGANTAQSWWLMGAASWNISSIRLDDAKGWGCNSIGVHAAPYDSIFGTWYFQCINRSSTGIKTFGFGPGQGYYNDNVDAYALRNDPTCPTY